MILMELFYLNELSNMKVFCIIFKGAYYTCINEVVDHRVHTP